RQLHQEKAEGCRRLSVCTTFTCILHSQRRFVSVCGPRSGPRFKKSHLLAVSQHLLAEPLWSESRDPCGALLAVLFFFSVSFSHPPYFRLSVTLYLFDKRDSGALPCRITETGDKLLLSGMSIHPC
ncbi:hypothetical protein CSUI_006026, partial [Cystoisospora suis]